MLQSVHIFLLQLLTAACGTKLPSAKAASCPQLAEGDIRALAERSGFDVVDGARSQQRGAIG